MSNPNLLQTCTTNAAINNHGMPGKQWPNFKMKERVRSFIKRMEETKECERYLHRPASGEQGGTGAQTAAVPPAAAQPPQHHAHPPRSTAAVAAPAAGKSLAGQCAPEPRRRLGCAAMCAARGARSRAAASCRGSHTCMVSRMKQPVSNTDGYVYTGVPKLVQHMIYIWIKGRAVRNDNPSMKSLSAGARQLLQIFLQSTAAICGSREVL